MNETLCAPLVHFPLPTGPTWPFTYLLQTVHFRARLRTVKGTILSDGAKVALIADEDKGAMLWDEAKEVVLNDKAKGELLSVKAKGALLSFEANGALLSDEDKEALLSDRANLAFLNVEDSGTSTFTIGDDIGNSSTVFKGGMNILGLFLLGMLNISPKLTGFGPCW